MGAALAAVGQAVVVVLVGAVLGYLPGGMAGALIGGALTLPFAVAYGRALALGRPYPPTRQGAWRYLVDATWSSLNTWAGALYYGVHRLFGNSLDAERSRRRGSLWLVKGVVPKYATTIGPVKAGSRDSIDRHEEVHVFQARLFGPFYLGLVGLNYVVATIVPYWLLFKHTTRARRPITGVGSYFEHGVYPHVWNELWAYKVSGGTKRPAGPRAPG